MPQVSQVRSALGKLVGPAKNFTTSNPFFALQGHTDSLPDSGHDPGPAQPAPPARAPPLTIASARTHQPQPQINTIAPSPIAHHRTHPVPKPRGVLIKLAGFVGPHPAVVLVDCGATGNFVSSAFAAKHGLALAGHPDTVCFADGYSTASGGLLPQASVRVGSYAEPIDLVATQLGGFDVILGMTWLEEYTPSVDWREKSLSFSDKQGRRHVLRKYSTGLAVWKPPVPPVPPVPSARSAPRRHGLNLITSRQLRRQNRDGLIDWAYLVAPELVSEVLDQIVSSAATGPAQHRCSAIALSPAFTNKGPGFHNVRSVGGQMQFETPQESLATLARGWTSGLRGAAAQPPELSRSPLHHGAAIDHDDVRAQNHCSCTPFIQFDQPKVKERDSNVGIRVSQPPSESAPERLSLGSGWPSLPHSNNAVRTPCGASGGPTTRTEQPNATGRPGNVWKHFDGSASGVPPHLCRPTAPSPSEVTANSARIRPRDQRKA